MSSETIVALVIAAMSGIGASVGGFVTSRKSGIADENRSLAQRVTVLERELTEERQWSVDMAHWAHDAAVQAAAQGIVLPDIPTRSQRREP